MRDRRKPWPRRSWGGDQGFEARCKTGCSWCRRDRESRTGGATSGRTETSRAGWTTAERILIKNYLRWTQFYGTKELNVHMRWGWIEINKKIIEAVMMGQEMSFSWGCVSIVFKINLGNTKLCLPHKPLLQADCRSYVPRIINQFLQYKNEWITLIYSIIGLWNQARC